MNGIKPRKNPDQGSAIINTKIKNEPTKVGSSSSEEVKLLK